MSHTAASCMQLASPAPIKASKHGVELWLSETRPPQIAVCLSATVVLSRFSESDSSILVCLGGAAASLLGLFLLNIVCVTCAKMAPS